MYWSKPLIDCRVCILKEPHVHVRENVLEFAYQPPDGFAFRPTSITGIDFNLPAVEQDGRWWLCQQELVDMVWPRWQHKISQRRRRIAEKVKLGLRPPEQEPQDDQEQN